MFKCNRSQPQPAIDVLIRYRGRRSFHATAQQITEDGMFLNTQLLSLPLNTDIELQFSIGGGNYRIPAVVIDDCSQGIYVGFYTLQPGICQTFHNLQQRTPTIPLPAAA